MKRIVLAAVAASTVTISAGAAKADPSSDVAVLKAEAAALAKQNEALERRLERLERKQAAQAKAVERRHAAAPAPQSFLAQAGKTSGDLLNGEGPLTWNGITVFGTIDAGVGYVSHGLPDNGQNYEGQSLINKYTNHARWGVAQNNLSQTTLGVKGEEELLPGLAGVFMASTGINPQSGQLANMPGTLVSNQGLPRQSYSFSGDGGRGGQAFNDQLFVGLSSKTFGELTFGRHRPFSVDLVVNYDPTGAAYSFSPIAYNGQFVQGLGATEDARWDDSLKYRVTYGPVHFGAMYKFADGNGGCNYVGRPAVAGAIQTCYPASNTAYQFNLGGTYGALNIDAVGGVYHDAVVIAGGNSPLSAAQLAGASVFTSNSGIVVNSTGNNANTLQALISDNVGFALAAKYSWNQFKFFAGYAHDELQNPSDNVGVGATNQEGGYILSSVNNNFYPHPKILQTFWAGVRYAYNSKLELIGAYYHVSQNQFGTDYQNLTCITAVNQSSKAAQCAGDLNAASAFADYHFTKRFDVYGGLEVSTVDGGIAGGTVSPAGKLTALGFNYLTNWAPVVGARFTF
ncbi:porin [Rhodoblastus acidophilus]|uniref:Porin n=1 Tax=Candidatus Rhodoblastus alkanivorans TaxID=2954117 RepID=A0ABS9Z498_9HYPH|nr:porin [Candidatus Rhodoblastus alkanivorans]MCI4677527.1 porin [Candidatus Rhodoblastus alkanivorans]MCI4681886.1 porin [Candidatus Rhodoblastus alkanivorans]MDI4642936.1 porin [Rhodoblastus acidophilus]